MASRVPATTVRIDPELKREATEVLDGLGLSMSSAINAFLRALVREQGMPFEMRVGGKRAAHGPENDEPANKGAQRG